MQLKPIPAGGVQARKGETSYPEPFARQVWGRTRRRLGDQFGLGNFGVNLTELEPGVVSALCHAHTRQDEFVYVLQGNPTVVIGEDEYAMKAGDCVGFKAGTGVPHQLVNRTDDRVIYLEIGDRTPGDGVHYPNDDLHGYETDGGQFLFTHKDGTPY